MTMNEDDPQNDAGDDIVMNDSRCQVWKSLEQKETRKRLKRRLCKACMSSKYSKCCFIALGENFGVLHQFLSCPEMSSRFCDDSFPKKKGETNLRILIALSTHMFGAPPTRSTRRTPGDWCLYTIAYDLDLLLLTVGIQTWLSSVVVFLFWRGSWIFWLRKNGDLGF